MSSWTVPSLGRLDCFSESPFMNEMYCSDRVVATCTHTHTHTCVIFSKKLNIRNRLCTSFSNNCRRRGNRSNGWDFSPSRTALYSGSREWMWRIRRRQERTTVYSLRAMLRLAWWKRAWRVWTVSTCISTTIIYAYVCVRDNYNMPLICAIWYRNMTVLHSRGEAM